MVVGCSRILHVCLPGMAFACPCLLRVNLSVILIDIKSDGFPTLRRPHQNMESESLGEAHYPPGTMIIFTTMF